MKIPSDFKPDVAKRLLGENPTILDMDEAFTWASSEQGFDYWADLVRALGDKKITRLPFKARLILKKMIAASEGDGVTVMPYDPPPPNHYTPDQKASDKRLFATMQPAHIDVIKKGRLQPKGKLVRFDSGPEPIALIKKILSGEVHKGKLSSAFSWSASSQGGTYWAVVAAVCKELPWCARLILESWIEYEELAQKDRQLRELSADLSSLTDDEIPF